MDAEGGSWSSSLSSLLSLGSFRELVGGGVAKTLTRCAEGEDGERVEARPLFLLPKKDKEDCLRAEGIS